MHHLLQQRALQAQTSLATCRLCSRDCGVDRRFASAGAFCRLDARAWIYKELLSVGEEAVLNPTWLVDVGGCSLRCLYCSEWPQVVQPRGGPAVELEDAWFAARMAHRRAQGAVTLTLVGGEPTVNLPALLRALAHCTDPLPVVWNTNGLLTAQARDLLDGVVAVWSLDAKFGNPGCALRISGFAADVHHGDWLATAHMALRTEPRAGLPPLVVRHLLMPGHLDCCTLPVLRELADVAEGAERSASSTGPGMYVNLMTWYAAPRHHPRLCHADELQADLAQQQVSDAILLARGLLGSRLWVNGRALAPR